MELIFLTTWEVVVIQTKQIVMQLALDYERMILRYHLNVALPMKLIAVVYVMEEGKMILLEDVVSLEIKRIVLGSALE